MEIKYRQVKDLKGNPDPDPNRHSRELVLDEKFSLYIHAENQTIRASSDKGNSCWKEEFRGSSVSELLCLAYTRGLKRGIELQQTDFKGEQRGHE